MPAMRSSKWYHLLHRGKLTSTSFKAFVDSTGLKLVDKDGKSQAGDYVVVDLEGTSDGKPVPGLNVDEWTYEIGRGWVAPGFDDQMTGVTKGALLDGVTFSGGAVHTHSLVMNSSTRTVREVRMKRPL